MSSSRFPIQPVARFSGPCQPVRRPKEFTYFSYDESHELRLDASSLKYYYPPLLGADLSAGFESFKKHDDSQDEHLDSLLAAIANYEKESGQKIDANFVTWRGMMTKIMSVPFDDRDGFEMNATLYQVVDHCANGEGKDCIFIEENHSYKLHRESQQGRGHGAFSPAMMSYWGYKFETLSTLPAPWAETSRDYIESRESLVVNNEAQYCSVVRTGIGRNNVLCLGGEVDCVWDEKPEKQGDPIQWVELKTSAEIESARDAANFERKLMKFWIQSFLLGVPRIIVGFRDRNGTLVRIEQLETIKIPDRVRVGEFRSWDGNTCINFASAFLDWLRKTINDEGVWRIQRRPGSPTIEVFKVEEVGHGRILTDDFINWRIKLALGGNNNATS